jgi:hypothetical protein
MMRQQQQQQLAAAAGTNLVVLRMGKLNILSPCKHATPHFMKRTAGLQ